MFYLNIYVLPIMSECVCEWVCECVISLRIHYLFDSVNLYSHACMRMCQGEHILRRVDSRAYIKLQRQTHISDDRCNFLLIYL